MLNVKIIENKSTACKNCIYASFRLRLKLFQIFSLLQYFQYILQLIYQLIFSCSYSFYSLNIHQHQMIYHNHTHNEQDSKYILCRIHLYQLILCIHTCINHHSNVVYYYICLHLIYIYTYMFHAILCAIHDIRLNTLTFKFFNTFLHVNH